MNAQKGASWQIFGPTGKKILGDEK